MNIAIQGIKGSFHHLAASTYFGDAITLNECMSYNEIPQILIQDQADHAVIAIENSNAGAILSNYKLIDSHDLYIIGEVFLPMIHNLVALDGQDIYDIREVRSHPMAIQQCRKFFRDHPHLRIVEDHDTASVVKAIKEQKLKGVAAIASAKAAEIYKLDILLEAIQSDEVNIMRFFVLSKQRTPYPDDYLNNKASLKFISRMQTGALAEILSVFAQHKLDLCKIQSMPINSEPWNYAFYMDVTFEDYQKYCQALIALEDKVRELKILGEYVQNFSVVDDQQLINGHKSMYKDK